MDKEIWKIILKTAAYVISLILSFLGGTAAASVL